MGAPPPSWYIDALMSFRASNSWEYPCKGGCVVYSSGGELLAKANREGREETLRFDLKLG